MPIHPIPRSVLCVAEKPSIAKEISRILSSGQSQSNAIQGNVYVKNITFDYKLPPHPQPIPFTVTSVLGHVNASDFGERHKGWRSCDPFDLFDAEIIESVGDKMKGVVDNLVRQARNHDLLLIWTDCDREGEHIGSEIMRHCQRGNPRIKVLRSRFSAIIPNQIHNAARNPVPLDMLSASAVEARQELDLRTGAAITRMQTLALQAAFPELDKKVISYGPCQFPTLGFVVARYLEIQAFVSETFWFIYVSQERDDDQVVFKWARNHLFDFEASVILYEQCVEDPEAEVLSVENKPTKKWKPLPLTTVELQKAGSRLLRMSPKKVLEHAEKLYQKGFLSYPRTETDQYDKAFDFATLIGKQTNDGNWGAFAQGLQDGGFRAPRNGKKNDKAHPPIHPTAWTNTAVGDEKRVYEFVVRRFLASCSSDAEGRTTTVQIEIAGEHFSTSGLVVLARNYLDVYPYDRWATSTIPDFQVGETFVPDVCELREGQTTQPSLLTEADLVSLMDKNGIGTDATIAEHISRIIDREYCMTQQEGTTKFLVPSNLGIALVEGWDKIGLDRSLCRPHLRRETEHRMQLICDGQQTKADVLAESIEQYKEVFRKGRQDMRILFAAVTKYLRNMEGDDSDGGDPPPADGRNGNGRDQGGAGSDPDSDVDDFGRGGGDGGGGVGGAAGRRGAGARGEWGGRAGAGRAAAARRSPPPAARPPARPPPKKRGRALSDDENHDPHAPGPSAPRFKASPSKTRGVAAADAPPCRCSKSAVERTVTRDSENKGRAFWTCPDGKDDGCGFFEWVDGPSGSAAPAKRPSSAAQVARPPPAAREIFARNDGDDRDDGRGATLKCNCNLTAVERTVMKENPNKGRKFWTCPNSQAAQCDFFKWDDEVNQGAGGSEGSRRSGDGGRGGAVGACYKCHQEGHWANECPTDGAGAGSGGQSEYASNGRGGSSSGRGARGSARGGSTRGRGRGASSMRGRAIAKRAAMSRVKKESKPKIERAVKPLAVKRETKPKVKIETKPKVKTESKPRVKAER